MPSVGNPNRPDRGSSIRVEPIKSVRDIQSIKKLLADNPRNLCLFTMGVNTNLRAGDLLRIKVSQVDSLGPESDLVLKEQKTGKGRRITLNKAVVHAIRTWLAEKNAPKGDDYLFKSQRSKVLKVSSVNKLVKSWCRQIHLKGNYGSHTLRKTWGYQQRVAFGVSLPELMVCFNHSTQKQTLDYLCIQPEEIREIYKNVI